MNLFNQLAGKVALIALAAEQHSASSDALTIPSNNDQTPQVNPVLRKSDPSIPAEDFNVDISSSHKLISSSGNSPYCFQAFCPELTKVILKHLVVVLKFVTKFLCCL